ncbi:hypothetical protein [Nocardia jinanensis]|uniref:Uncharacterized protein n=1 Tax=Nocardia jinanensis TaxID=382504 RepID=A0A917RSB8_9NOCA|nr:hypothetical protein [Nocardia jinanensis]GGL23466.1 hypothetical protein GCM10011588_42970 [Nocardia jinanensis]
MRHFARAPQLLRVLVLVFAAVVLTLEVRDGQMVDPRETTYVSLVFSIVAANNSAETEVERPGETGGQSVHCRYACVRAAVPRPRFDDLWPVALVFLGLVVGLLDSARRRPRMGLPAPASGAAGGRILLRLCVCRR